MAAREVEAQAIPEVGERGAAPSEGTQTAAGPLPALTRSGLPRWALTPAMLLQLQRTAGNRAAAGLAASVPARGDRRLGRDLAGSGVADRSGFSAGSLSGPARQDESEREPVQSPPAFSPPGRSARAGTKTLQRMRSKVSGEEIPDAILIGERHDSPDAKEFVLGRLETWWKQGYTRLGIELAADYVIPEGVLTEDADEELLAVINRIPRATKPYKGFTTGNVLRAAKDNGKLRDHLPTALGDLYETLIHVIVAALKRGYSVECLDTAKALHGPLKQRVAAFDNSAVDVIAGAGARRGFIALVGAAHLAGIALRLDLQLWSYEQRNLASAGD